MQANKRGIGAYVSFPFALKLTEQENPSGVNFCRIVPDRALMQAVIKWLPKPTRRGTSNRGPKISFQARTIASPSSRQSAKTRPLSRESDPYFTAFVTSS